jgi:hypothetical protein
LDFSTGFFRAATNRSAWARPATLPWAGSESSPPFLMATMVPAWMPMLVAISALRATPTPAEKCTLARPPTLVSVEGQKPMRKSTCVLMAGPSPTLVRPLTSVHVVGLTPTPTPNPQAIPQPTRARTPKPVRTPTLVLVGVSTPTPVRAPTLGSVEVQTPMRKPTCVLVVGLPPTLVRPPTLFLAVGLAPTPSRARMPKRVWTLTLVLVGSSMATPVRVRTPTRVWTLTLVLTLVLVLVLESTVAAMSVGELMSVLMLALALPAGHRLLS